MRMSRDERRKVSRGTTLIHDKSIVPSLNTDNPVLNDFVLRLFVLYSVHYNGWHPSMPNLNVQILHY